MYWLIIPVAVYSLGILTLWLIVRRRRGDERPAAVGATMVTVVVAARNEAGNIEPLLESLARQDYPHDLLEIIIVNDNSTDRTPIVVSGFIERNRLQSGLRMRLIYNPFSGKKRAIRYGIEKASGELILTTDADCTVGPGWVSAHAGAFAAGGKSGHAAANEPPGKIAHAEAGAAGRVQAAYVPPGGNAYAKAGAAGSADMILGEVCHEAGEGLCRALRHVRVLGAAVGHRGGRHCGTSRDVQCREPLFQEGDLPEACR